MTDITPSNADQAYTQLAPLSFLTREQNVYRNTPEYQHSVANSEFEYLTRAQYNRIKPVADIRGGNFALKGQLMRRARTALCMDKVELDLARNAQAYEDSFSDRVMKATMALLRYNGKLQQSIERASKRQTKDESRRCQRKLTTLLNQDKLNSPDLSGLYQRIPMIRNMTEEREFHNYIRNRLAEQRKLSKAFADSLANVEIEEILMEA